MEVVPYNPAVTIARTRPRRPARLRYGVFAASTGLFLVGVANRRFDLGLDAFYPLEHTGAAVHPLADVIPACHALISFALWLVSFSGLSTPGVPAREYLNSLDVTDLLWTAFRWYLNYISMVYLSSWSCVILSWFQQVRLFGFLSGDPNQTSRPNSALLVKSEQDTSIR